MPDGKVLYMAKSLTELNNLANTSFDNDPNRIYKSSNKVYEAAVVARLAGDEERSYVLYMRYAAAICHIKKTREYCNNKKYYDSMIKKSNMEEAIKWCETFSQSLENRYKLQKEEEEVRERLCKMNLNKADSERPPSPKHVKIEVDKREPKSDVVEDSRPKESCSAEISVLELYDILISKSDDFVLMDVRSHEDYQESHILYSCCINIPEEIIKPGISAPRLDPSVPEASRSLWNNRAKMDKIILLDWNSSLSKLGVAIESLKSAIYVWDVTTKLKREPLILSGGYAKWLEYYPTMTTNSHIRIPTVPEDNLDQDLLNFDYPTEDLDKAFYESSSDSSGDSHNLMEDSSANSSAINVVGKSMPIIDRSKKPSMTKSFYATGLAGGQRQHNEEKKVNESEDRRSLPRKLLDTEVDDASSDAAKTNTTAKQRMPSFDRNLKPKITNENESFKESDNQNQQILLDNISKTSRNLDASVNLEKERLINEEEIDLVRLKKEKEADESMKLELQKREEFLLDKVAVIEEDKKRLAEEHSQILAENEKLKGEMKELMKTSEEARRFKEEVDKKEAIRLSLEKEVQKLRLDRKKKESQAKIQSKKDEISLTPKNSPKGSPKSQRNPSTTGVSFAKLKSEEDSKPANRNLSRSQSFPNISQMVENEALNNERSIHSAMASNQTPERSHFPVIDRNIKPTQTELDAASNRNLMPIFGGLGRALTGLRNLGNTCYMNSVIQALANTRTLVTYICTGNYRGDINRNNKLNRKGQLVEEFAALIRALWTGQFRSVSPKDFKRVYGCYHKDFVGYEQQDAQEFLTLLMDSLHEELNKPDLKRVKEMQEDMKTLEENSASDSTIAIKSWEIHKLLNESIIVELYQGQYKSVLTCMVCGKTSTKFDPVMYLSVPIPSGANKCSLKECLQLYLKQEKMTGASRWECPRCKEKRESTKKIDIWNFPPILIVHLKRFFYEGVWRKKLQTYIDFPIEELDLTSYVKGPNCKNVRFSLFAVTNHYGTLEGGHYTSFCKNTEFGRWFKFDDQDVHEMNVNEVKSSAAYILYYKSLNLRG